jgi:hypothetical protein
MSEEQTSTIAKMEFQYPKRPWFFALSCHLVMLGLFTLFYFGKISGQYSKLYFVIAVSYAFLGITSTCGLEILFGKQKKTIILDEEGIKFGNKSVKWEDIEKIKDGPWTMRKSMVRIKLKKKEKKFFSLTWKTSPVFLNIPPAIFVYRDVLPTILAVRPDIPVGKITKKCIASPEWAVAPERRSIVLAILISAGMFCALLIPRFQNIFDYMVIAALLGIAHSILQAASHSSLGATTKDSFIRFALTCPILLISAAPLHALSVVEYSVLEGLVITTLLVLLMAILVLFAVKEMKLGLQAAILCVLAGVPTGTYIYQKSQQWPARDISSILCGDKLVLAVWGNSGKYITSAWYEGNGCVIDANTLKKVSLPSHDGKTLTIWLDERFMVRRIKSTDNDNNEPVNELWVYDFAKQQEFKMPASRRFSIGKRRQVDYTGRYLAWIDNEQNNHKLRIYNIETMTEDINAPALPSDVNLSAGQPNWVGEKEIAVFNSNCEENRLALWLNIDNGQFRLYTSSQNYKNWYPTADFRYAIGANELKNEHYLVAFVDLEKDTSTPITGENIPLEAPEARRLFHVVETKTGAYLASFGYVDSEDKLLYRVSKEMSVLGVSPTGKYVLLGFDKFLNFPIYTVINTINGRRHKIHLPGFTGALSASSIALMPYASRFSPDEHWLMLETIEMERHRTLLFEIPENW